MATVTQEPEYLTLPEVAIALQVSVPTVRRKITEGELPAVQLGGPGSSLRVPRAALTAWLWSEGETRG